MSKPVVMHVHFWGDVRRQSGSVDKVIAAFSEMDDLAFTVEIACLGEGQAEPYGRATLYPFTEDRLKNKLGNKLLGLKLFTFSRLVSLINQRRPALLHIHNRHALVDRLVAGLAYRPCVLCHYHRKFGEFLVPDSADALIVVSAAVRDALIAACVPTVPVEVVYNPVPAGVAANEPLPLGGRKPRLLYGGGRQKNKGFFELEAALSSSGLADCFEIVLCGPEFADYLPPFPARVAGMLAASEFLAEMTQADIVSMPSHHEGFSILALEALGMGKLLVATCGGGLGEILNEQNALIHEIADAADLAEKLQLAAHLMQPASWPERLSRRQAALQTAARFSVEAINRDLAAVYRRYLGLQEEGSI
jgi:glycosyltransferase involved in cell wall biosynthesis